MKNEVAKWMMTKGYATGHGDSIGDLLEELEWQIRESEREACAKVCEEQAKEYASMAAWKLCNECANAIRTRGDKHD